MRWKSNTLPDDPIVVEVRSMPDHEVARWAELGQFGFKQVAAKQELARRAFWREFWSHGVVAWVALVVSIAALAISLLKAH